MSIEISNPAVVLGILFAILAFVFTTSSKTSPGWRRFYTFVPPLLLCYFLPSLLTSFDIVPKATADKLYHVASRYALPTSLALLTISIDLPAVLRLGPKALVLFLSGTVSIVLGGPLVILLFRGIGLGEWVGGEGPDAAWRGMSTAAGSWIGGGANQTAMKDVWKVSDETFGVWATVDVLIASVWMAILLLLAGRSKRIDERIGADVSSIEALKKSISDYQAQTSRIPKLADTMRVLGVGFSITAVSHVVADLVAPWIKSLDNEHLSYLNLDSPFFWIVVTATTIGLLLSFTKARDLEGVGASRLGSVCLYFLVTTIGLKIDVRALLEYPELFAVGGLWMSFHAATMLTMCRLMRAPVFFMAVGSQSNVGGAASAPIVASAFHPSLATVGVLLATLGYALGTYGAWLCAILMRAAAGDAPS